MKSGLCLSTTLSLPGKWGGAEAGGVQGATSRVPQLLRGLGVDAPALAEETPVKLERLLIGVSFQGQGSLSGSFLLSSYRPQGTQSRQPPNPGHWEALSTLPPPPTPTLHGRGKGRGPHGSMKQLGTAGTFPPSSHVCSHAVALGNSPTLGPADWGHILATQPR